MTRHGELPFRLGGRKLLIALFDGNPERWFPSPDLRRIAGECAWRTRLSEARITLEQREGWELKNRLRVVNGYTISEYGYFPKATQTEAA